MQIDLFNTHDENKLYISKLEDEDEIDVFEYEARSKSNDCFGLLLHIERLKPHKEDKSFKNKIKEIRRDVKRQRQEITDLHEATIKELLKGLSSERINQLQQFEADEFHVGDQCQVCLEEVEVGRLMKQLDCGGRHSFCSGCTDTWFAENNTCPICRHVFV